MRCPDCQNAKLNTPSYLVRLNKRTVKTLPLKVCRHCDIIIVDVPRIKKYRMWAGADYVDLLRN